MAKFATGPPSLAGLPAEILLEVYQHLDIQAMVELSLVNHEFQAFFQRHRVDIILPIIIRDFSPLNELLQVYTASVQDIAFSGHYKPRTILFQRFQGDHGLDMGHSASGSLALVRRKNAIPPRSDGQRGVRDQSSGTSKEIVLTGRDLNHILRYCRIVSEWEGLFPQMRWYHQPEYCRLLRPHEQVRFRRALYRWWMYGIHFHGEFPRPRAAHPEPFVDDVRTSQIRYYSTAELLELMDFLETVRDIITHYICPRLDPTPLHQAYTDASETGGGSLFHTLDQPLLSVDVAKREQSLRESWLDQSHWGRVVKTYAKLGPESLLYYFNNISSYPRQRLLADVWVRHPSFAFDQESIQTAVRCVLDERDWPEDQIDLAEHGVGGIIDFDDERDHDRLGLQGDASPDGRLPNGFMPVQSHSRWSPRGDDGSLLYDFRRFPNFGSQRYAFPALEALN